MLKGKIYGIFGNFPVILSAMQLTASHTSCV